MNTLNRLFSEEQVEQIVSIPLVNSSQPNVLAWRGNKSRIYTARSGYRWRLTEEQLLLGDEYITQMNAMENYYTKIWSLNVSSKIRINLWRITKNYLPRICNLKLRTTALCPVCGEEDETTTHLFRDCNFTRDVLQKVGMLTLPTNEN